jgi:PAS domain S-box-containing protein
MTIRGKLLAGLALIVALAVIQGGIVWRHSSATQRELAQVHQSGLPLFATADKMLATLAKLEPCLLAATQLNSATSGGSTFAMEGKALLQQFRMNLDAASLLPSGGAKDEDSAGHRHAVAAQRSLLTKIEVAFDQFARQWNQHYDAERMPTEQFPAIATPSMEQLRRAVVRYHEFLESGLADQIEHVVTISQASHQMMLTVTIFFVFAVLILLLLLTKSILPPLEQIATAARGIAAGERQLRLPVNRADELGDVSAALNHMLESLQATTISRDELESLVHQRTAELERFFSVSTDAMCVRDLQGNLLRVNPAFARLFDYTEAELLASPPQRDIHPEDLPKMQEALRQLASGELATAAFEIRRRARDGAWRTLVWTAVAAPDVKRIYGTARDVTELRQAVQALRANEENLATTLNSIGDGVLATDAEGRVLRLNPMAEALTGWKLVEAVNRPYHEVFRLVDESAQNSVEVPVASVMALGRTVNLPDGILLVHRSGSQRPITDSCAPIRDASGKVTGSVLVFRDVTKEREATRLLRAREEELRQINDHLETTIWQRTAALTESERRHRTLLENLQGMAYRCRNDADWTMEYLSKGCSTLLGVEPGTITSGQVSYASLIHPDDRELVWNDVQAAVAKKCPFTLEYRVRHVTGEWRWVWEQGQAVLNEQGEVEALEGFINDVTERKRAANAILQQESRLNNLFRALPLGVGTAKDRVIQEVSPRLCEMSGYSANELVGQNTRLLYASDNDYESVGRELYRRVQGLGSGSMESRWRRKNGEIYGVLLSCSSAEPAQPMSVTFSVTDISELKRAEGRIRQLSEAVEQSPVAVVITDLEGRIEYVNARFTQMTGYAAPEVLGRNPQLLKSGETDPEDFRKLWQTIKQGRTWHGQFHNRKKMVSCIGNQLRFHRSVTMLAKSPTIWRSRKT